MLSEAWMGRRIVIRRALSNGVGDVIGELRALGTRHAVINSRAGEVRIELRDVLQARLVEPATRDILALELIAARGWRAAEVTEVPGAQGWLLRANQSFSARANSILALRTPVPDLASALEVARAWYAERGLPVSIAIPLPPRRALDDALSRLGWPVAIEAAVMVAANPPVPTGPPTASVSPPVQLANEPDDPWLDEYQHHTHPAADVARALLTRHERVAFASVRSDGQVAAIARGTVDEDWLGVSAVAVRPDYRRQGLAQAMMAALSDWGRALGATQTYLQVEQTNTAAIALYEGLGFWRHHTYRYRTDPAAALDAADQC